ncbi:TfoX/Sxy family DNA transformation protein [Vibrio marisflavi]|uniref:DNA transformation protein TfoX1 n=1 Tax=Vibrio marisflavi CECT 7928 TaxID=634439 RepID=A0ABN8E6G9_9VIBR|nr:TfoX/Sxy family DNA transformation protein [Vibrio marisflavi]CAH0539495.1 DNA transformation protein TfoX1 [Vibrio marisflavi CECT 7928]
MTEEMLLDYMANFTKFRTRSMFGGIGLFNEGAMFAALTGSKLYIRGGGDLDKLLDDMNCCKLVHVKKQSTVTVNYYDVTKYIESDSADIKRIIARSIHQSVCQRAARKTSTPLRLRDLPNMRLTLERMVKKSGVKDVDTFMNLGASVVYCKVCDTYGSSIDRDVLWKFAGAIEGVHWKLIQEPQKRELLKQCREINELEPV